MSQEIKHSCAECQKITDLNTYEAILHNGDHCTRPYARYRVLGYSSKKEFEALREVDRKKRFRKLMLKWHPDKCELGKAVGQNPSTHIIASWGVLSDSGKKLLYDYDQRILARKQKASPSSRPDPAASYSKPKSPSPDYPKPEKLSDLLNIIRSNHTSTINKAGAIANFIEGVMIRHMKKRSGKIYMYTTRSRYYYRLIWNAIAAVDDPQLSGFAWRSFYNKFMRLRSEKRDRQTARILLTAVLRQISKPGVSTRKKIKFISRYLQNQPSWEVHHHEILKIYLSIINSDNYELMVYLKSRLNHVDWYCILYSEHQGKQPKSLMACLIAKFQNNPAELKKWLAATGVKLQDRNVIDLVPNGPKALKLNLAEYIIFELEKPSLLSVFYNTLEEGLKKVNFKKVLKCYCSCASDEKLTNIVSIQKKMPALYLRDLKVNLKGYYCEKKRKYIEHESLLTVLLQRGLYQGAIDILERNPEVKVEIDIYSILRNKLDDDFDVQGTEIKRLLGFIESLKNKYKKITIDFEGDIALILQHYFRYALCDVDTVLPKCLAVLKELKGLVTDETFASIIVNAQCDISNYSSRWFYIRTKLLSGLFPDNPQAISQSNFVKYQDRYLNNSCTLDDKQVDFVQAFLKRYADTSLGVADIFPAGYDDMMSVLPEMFGVSPIINQGVSRYLRMPYKQAAELSHGFGALLTGPIMGIIYAPFLSIIESTMLIFNTLRYGLPQFLRSEDSLLLKVLGAIVYVPLQLAILTVFAVIQLALSPITGLLNGAILGGVAGIKSTFNPYQHYLRLIIRGMHKQLWRLNNLSSLNSREDKIRHISTLYKSRTPEHVILGLSLLAGAVTFTLIMLHVLTLSILGSYGALLQGLGTLALAGIGAGVCVGIGILVLGTVWSIRKLVSHCADKDHSLLEPLSSERDKTEIDLSDLHRLFSATHAKDEAEEVTFFGDFRAHSDLPAVSFKNSDLPAKYKTQDPSQALRRWVVSDNDDRQAFEDFSKLMQYADINASDSNPAKGYTALHIAVMQGIKASDTDKVELFHRYLKRAKLLLDYGANANLKDAEGKSVKDIVKYSISMREELQYHLTHGAARSFY